MAKIQDTDQIGGQTDSSDMATEDEAAVPYDIGSLDQIDDGSVVEGEVKLDEYEELDEEAEESAARKKLLMSSDDTDVAGGGPDKDDFLDSADYDPDEKWALGD